MICPKMTAFVLQSITPAVEAKIKERYHPERTTAINEDDIVAMVPILQMVKLIMIAMVPILQIHCP